MDSSSAPVYFEILEALHDTTLASIRTRKAYAAAGVTPSNDKYYWVYVLLLQGAAGQPCVYVGATNNIYQRLLDHYTMSERSSVWVRARGPVIKILELVYAAGPDDERYKYYEWCTVFGWQHVRGYKYCKVPAEQPPGLVDFVRDRTDFNYVSRAEMDALQGRVTTLAASLKTEKAEKAAVGI